MVQINTGTGCHLEADMVARGFAQLRPGSGSVVQVGMNFDLIGDFEMKARSCHGKPLCKLRARDKVHSAGRNGRAFCRRPALNSNLGAAFAAFFYISCSVISSAHAQQLEYPRVVNMASMTCGEFVQLSIPRAFLAIGWIRGYYSGLNHETTVDVSEFLDKAERVISLCRDNESTAVMALIDRILHPDRPR